MTTEKEEIPCCENCPTIRCFHHPNHWKTSSQCWSRNDHIHVWEFTKEHGAACHPGARAYLNKDVIAELESWINGLEYPDCPPGDSYARVIALLRGDNK